MCTQTSELIPDTPLLELKRCLMYVQGLERKAELEKNKIYKAHVHVYKFISVNYIHISV